MSSDAHRGIDLLRLTPWLTERLPELEPPLRFTRVGEGQSNLTFRVDDAAGHALVLRRPPLGEILASAHDMELLVYATKPSPAWWYKVGTKPEKAHDEAQRKGPVSGAFRVAGAGFEPATSGL